MKRYCFLLLIILLCLLYDNNLYEGNNGEYDTSQDRIVQYEGSSMVNTGFLHYLTSFTGTLGFNLEDYIEMPAAPDERLVDCPTSADNDCESPIKPHQSKREWSYEIADRDAGGAKAKCMKCLTCRDKGAFKDEFYAFACDALAGCYDSPGDSIGDMMPYFYAYDNIDWNNEDLCQDSSKQPLANKTCQFIQNNTTLFDTLSYAKKADVIKCNANIALLNTSGVGSVVSYFEE